AAYSISRRKNTVFLPLRAGPPRGSKKSLLRVVDRAAAMSILRALQTALHCASGCSRRTSGETEKQGLTRSGLSLYLPPLATDQNGTWQPRNPSGSGAF